jgi:uncharacterized repeat protein (TIGR01451 family)
MSRRSLSLAVFALAAVIHSAPAQYGRAPRSESVEPPLADDPKAEEIIRLASARQVRPHVPAARSSELPAAAVNLRLIVPPTLPLNQDVDIRMVLENVSQVTARNALVVYPLQGATPVKSNPKYQTEPGYPESVIWKIESLPPGGRQEILLTVKPPTGAADFNSKARVILEQEQTARTRFAKSELKLTKTGPKQALRFDILVFGITVTNPTDIELRDITITDRLPPGLVHRPDDDKDRPFIQGAGRLTAEVSDGGQTRTWKIDRLAARESRRIEYYVATTTTASGVVQHQAFAEAAGGVQDTVTDKVELIEPKLELSVDAPPRKSANAPAPARITLKNSGPRLLQNIVVTDLLDPCKIESVGVGGQQLPNRVQWIVPLLGAGQTRVLELSVSKADGGFVAHKATAVYRGLERQAEARTEFEAVAALQYEFRGTPATIEVNGEVVYEITLRNSGSAAATNIRPLIELPPELVLVKAEPENKPEGGKVVFEPIPKLPPNGRATFRVTAKAMKPSLGARVTAELSGDPFPTGAVRRQEMTAIGASPAAPSTPAPAGKAPQPVPVAPPPGNG